MLPASSPCSRETAQWTAGAASNSACDTNNATYEASSLTYTTQPLPSATKIAGLITADLWAELTSTDATLVAVLSAGHRLRLTIGTANTFSSAPPLPNLGQELGGEITLLHGAPYDSNVVLPIVP